MIITITQKDIDKGIVNKKKKGIQACGCPASIAIEHETGMLAFIDEFGVDLYHKKSMVKEGTYTIDENVKAFMLVFDVTPKKAKPTTFEISR